MYANYGKECAIYGTLANREHFDDLMFWNYIQSLPNFGNYKSSLREADPFV